MHLLTRFFRYLGLAVVIGAVGATPLQAEPTPTPVPPIKNGASSVDAADINGDGHMDVVSASAGDGEIAWYPNNGEGRFPDKEIITIGAAGAQEIIATDLDGDGDIDILGAFGSENKVAWYENDGFGTFSSQNVITSEAAGAVSVYTADLDGDGDKDVLSASQIDGKIAYYTNQGKGRFSEQKVISNEGEGAQSVYTADLDGDGDQDVVYASSVRGGGSKIAWHRNTEEGFADQNIITNTIRGARSVYASDLDGDGDQDLLAAFHELGRGQVTWYENRDDSDVFSEAKAISSEVAGVKAVATSDLDDDGDQDIIATSGVSGADGEISFFLSTAGTFASKSVVAEDLAQAQSFCATDLDNSGTPDIVGASRQSDQIAWYENDLLQGFGFRDAKILGR